MPYAHSDKSQAKMPQADPEQVQMAERDAVQRPKLEGGKAFVMHTDFSPAGDQPSARPTSWPPTRRWRRSFTANSRASFRKMPLNTLSRFMTTTSQRPMSRARIPLLKRKARSTSRSTGCATRPPALCWNATM